MNVLHIDSVQKSYGNKTILSDVFLSCKTGEIIGLVGRNGSGKSTLLKIIFGSEKAEFKFVKVNQKVIKSISDGRYLVNYLPQNHFLPTNAKVKTLIKLSLSKKNSNTLFQNEHIKPLLNKKSQDLSGGEKRIIEILLVIHSDSEFILLDEPFSGVSPIMREYIISYIKNMKPYKGYIITDHDYKNVINLADEIVLLNNGFLKKIENKNQLVELGYISKSIYKNTYG